LQYDETKILYKYFLGEVMKNIKLISMLYLISILFAAGGLLKAQNEWNLYSDANDINSVEVQGLNVWLGTNGGGLVKVSRTDGSMVFYTKENSGLPGMIINDIRIDGTSSIWVATDNGLAYFNGTDWTVYRTGNSGLPSNTVLCVTIDAFNRKWIGTNEGVAVLDGRDWTVYNTANSDLPSNIVNDIGLKPTGSKWMATTAGLTRFDGATWTIYNTGNSEIPSGNVLTVNFQEYGAGVIVGTDAGVAFLLGTTWTVYDTGNSDLPSDIINDIGFDSQDRIWLATANGLARYQSNNWLAFNSANTPLSNDFVHSLSNDTDDYIWVGTRDSLNKFKDTVWTKYFVNQTLLESNFVNDIKTDKNGVAWFATEIGLASYNGAVWNFYENTRQYKCRKLAFDNNGVLWVATDSGAAKFNAGNFEFFNTNNSLIPSDFVTFITFDVFNNMWVGTDNGLAKYNGTNWTIYNVGNSGLPDNYILYLTFEGNTHCWIGTMNGLAMFDGIDWTVYDPGNSDLPGNYVTSIQIDENGDKWIGMLQAGLSFFPDTAFYNFDSNNSDLVSDDITALSFDKNGNLWIGTMGSGIMRKKDSVWTAFNINETPLPSSMINSLFVDDGNNIWISTETGAAVFNAGGITPSVFITYTDTNVCAGNDIKVVFRNLFAFQVGNEFLVELSDGDGNFDDPVIIGRKTSTSPNGKDSIICVIPSDFLSGNYFRVRIRTTKPAVMSEDNGFDIKIRELPKPEIRGRRIVCFDATESYFTPWQHNITYFWRVENGTIIGADTTNVVTVNWSNSSRSGNLILIETNELGCSDSLVIQVQIMGHPRMFITGPKKVCAGREYVYASDTSHNVRYWSAVGGKVIKMPDYNKVAIVWTAQEYGVVKLVEVTAGGCTDSVFYNVTIEPTPTADIDGPLEIMEGETGIYVTEATSSGIDKKWYAVNGEIVGDDDKDTVTVRWPNGGFGAVIQAQLSETGCSDSNIVTVRIFEKIDILGLRNVCEGSNILYEANKNLGAYAQWYVTGGAFDGPSNGRTCRVIWGDAGTGVLKLVQWIPNTSYRDSITIDVNINAIPAKPTITEHLDTLISSADVGNQWFWNGQLIPGATNKKYYTYQIRGNYTVKVTVAHGCESPMSDIFSFISAVEVNTANDAVSIFPNPSDGIFTLQVNVGESAMFSYDVYNILGQKVLEDSKMLSGMHKETLNMQNFPAGVYYLRINLGDDEYQRKLVISK
jgi:ligand-binding sensor domain-containing protein